MRLRPLTEAECYARCYGERREEAVSILRFVPMPEHGQHAEPEAREAPDGREAA